MNKPNFFIFGKHRSGTTMLSAMLSSHPHIYVANDSVIFQMFALSIFDRHNPLVSKVIHANRSLLAKFSSQIRTDLYRIPFEGLPKADANLTKYEKEQFIARLLRRYRHKDDDTSLDEVSWLSTYENAITRRDLNAFYNEMYSVRQVLTSVFEIIANEQLKNAQVFGEKSPTHSYLAPWLREIYPEAKFITLIRNPVTNVASMFSRYNSVDKHLLVRAVDRYMSYHHEKLDILYDPNESFVLRYEDIIADTDGKLAEIYRVLEIPNDKIYTDLASNRPNYTGSKVDSNRADKSRNVLDKVEVGYIKQRCRRILKKYYPEEL